MRALANVIAAAAIVLVPVSSMAATTTPIAEARKGTAVTVQGAVARITDDDEFILSDDSGSIEIYLDDGRVPVAVGEQVTVSGWVDDDFGPREIYASSITRSDGTTVSISRGGYDYYESYSEYYD